MSTELLVKRDIDFWTIDEDDLAAEEWLPPLERIESANADPPDHQHVRASFDVLADELADAARGLSSTRRAMKLPAYEEIVAMGDAAIPLALERLETSANRPLWLRVLSSLTSFEPSGSQDTIDSAADAWRRWGRHTRS